jgi:hypothetical protein
MDNSNSSQHVMDNFPYEMGLVLKVVEFLICVLYFGFVVGMYRGIEINHPGLKFTIVSEMIFVKFTLTHFYKTSENIIYFNLLLVLFSQPKPSISKPRTFYYLLKKNPVHFDYVNCK